MIETHYLVDNNALGFLGASRVESSFFKEWCHVTSDVLHEARYRPFVEQLRPTEITVTAAVLRDLVEVMATVPVGDTKLVDLYANRGMADPVLVATAKVEMGKQSESLLPDSWVIVTSDKAVKDKAAEFGIPASIPQELADVIDATGPLQG